MLEVAKAIYLNQNEAMYLLSAPQNEWLADYEQ